MPRTAEHVRLRRPCPCAQGEVLMIYREADLNGAYEGFFLAPEIVCPACVSGYHAHYRADPDRVELVPAAAGAKEVGQAGVIVYEVQQARPAHVDQVQHAQGQKG